MNVININLDNAAKFYAIANCALNSNRSQLNFPASTHVRYIGNHLVPLSDKGCEIIWNRGIQQLETEEEYEGLQNEYKWWKKKLKTKTFKQSALQVYSIQIT